ncbi:DUF4625 domain-containing protein [Niabella aquatica]
MTKHNFFTAALLLSGIGLLTFASCKKDGTDKPAAPTIQLLHLGTHANPDNRIFHLGEENHFEANISAPGLVEKIEVIVQQKSGYGTYSNTKEYKGDYVGQKNVEGFHDHPVIPAGQAIGEYRFTIRVTDQAGQVSKVEETIDVQASDGGGGHEH